MKKLILAAVVLMVSMTAHADLWAIAGNKLEGFVHLYDDKPKTCPAEYQYKGVLILTDGSRKPLCYEVDGLAFKFFAPETNKKFILPWTAFASTPYGDANVMQLR